MKILGRLADRRAHDHAGAARQGEISCCGEEPQRRMGLQALRKAETVGMGVFRIGDMRAERHLGAERRLVRMKGRRWCRAAEKSLEHKCVEGEGREPLPQHFLKSCPHLAHGANRASKSCGGQATREDVMNKGQPSSRRNGD